MSKGLGYVARSLHLIFVAGPPKLHSTSELCRIIYKTKHVEKKHRVAVLRALRTLVERNAVPIWCFVPKYEKADVEWFNPHIVGRPKYSRPLQPRKRARKSAPRRS